MYAPKKPRYNEEWNKEKISFCTKEGRSTTNLDVKYLKALQSNKAVTMDMLKQNDNIATHSCAGIRYYQHDKCIHTIINNAHIQNIVILYRCNCYSNAT